MNQGIILKKIWSEEDLTNIDVAASDGYPQHHAFAGVLGHIGGLPVPVNGLRRSRHVVEDYQRTGLRRRTARDRGCRHSHAQALNQSIERPAIYSQLLRGSRMIAVRFFQSQADALRLRALGKFVQSSFEKALAPQCGSA